MDLKINRKYNNVINYNLMIIIILKEIKKRESMGLLAIFKKNIPKSYSEESLIMGIVVERLLLIR